MARHHWCLAFLFHLQHTENLWSFGRPLCRAAASSDQVIVVGQVLASEVNIGFENIVNTSVLRINDKPVANLRQVRCWPAAQP